ncbi:MAG: sulfite exporter TauE/SafE family protein [Candidatus Omnitrophica bacterium]|nr:sulfite exporter TauE/SafE family protein [Candidatus Omnitrophota bacterium]
MVKAAAESFILGLSFGWGPCLASCGPLLLAYVAGTKKDVLQSVGAYLLFSLSRVFVYLVLGALVFFLGRFILERSGSFFKFVLLGSGVFIVLLGLLMLLGQEIKSHSCSFLYKHILEKDKKSIVMLGLTAGLLPCAPLITMFTYTGLVSQNILENLLYTLAFGLGTVLSPLIILVALAGILPRLVRGALPMKLFNIICGLIIIILGLQLIGRAG